MDDLEMASEFEQAMEAAMAENMDDVASAIDRHQDAVLAAERSIADARRVGNAAITAIDARCKRATVAYQETMERLARDRATIVTDMRRRIATAETLAAISRAALQAVQP